MRGRFAAGKCVCCSAVLLVAALQLLGRQAAATPGRGSAEGIVINQGGDPIADAHVYALPGMDMRIQIPSMSGPDGRFVLHDLAQGTIYIQAYKESDGYPYAFFSFYKTSDAQSVKTTVTAEKTTSGIVIQLGPEAAYLKFELSDQRGQQIESAQAIFRRDDMPGDYKRSVKNGETIMVPPVPFHLSVEAPGYTGWSYRGTTGKDSHAVVNLKPTQTLHIHVQFAAGAPE